jgi:CRP-like cAMP-binding protein
MSHRVVGSDVAFGPEEIKLLRCAFEDVLRTLHWADKEDAATLTIARRIIELAKTGERDHSRLRDGVLKSLAVNRTNLGSGFVGPPMRTAQPASGNLLLAALDAEDATLFGEQLKVHALARGSVLQEANAPIERVWFPHAGMVSLVVRMKDGRSVETASIGREGAINAAASLNASSSFTAIAQLPGSASYISAAQFQKVMRQSERFREVILAYQATLLAQIQQAAACHVLHPLEGRFARWLLQAHDRSPDGSLYFTQEDMAQLLGVRRTTVTILARLLQAKQLIQYRRGRISIIDRPTLEQYACECYEITRRCLKPRDASERAKEAHDPATRRKNLA